MSGELRRLTPRGPAAESTGSFTPAEPLPEKAYGKWYDGMLLTDPCRCGHDVGTHAQRTSICAACACGCFRPAEERP